MKNKGDKTQDEEKPRKTVSFNIKENGYNEIKTIKPTNIGIISDSSSSLLNENDD
jgi:hypothetical protein